MSDESYKKGLATGMSDGTTSGLRGAEDYAISQKNMARHRESAQRSHEAMAAADARLAAEGRKLGEGLMAMIAALFLHPWFSFVGFWLVCVTGLLLLASWSGLWEGGNGYVYSAMAIALVLATLLRKIVPTLMKWLFFTGIVALIGLFILKVVDLQEEKAAKKQAKIPPPSTVSQPLDSQAARRAAAQAALNEASKPEITTTAPGAGERGEMYEGVDLRICSMSLGKLEVCQRYCATLAEKNRPEWCQ